MDSKIPDPDPIRILPAEEEPAGVDTDIAIDIYPDDGHVQIRIKRKK